MYLDIICIEVCCCLLTIYIFNSITNNNIPFMIRFTIHHDPISVLHFLPTPHISIGKLLFTFKY